MPAPKRSNISRVDSGELYGMVTIGPDVDDKDNFRLDWKNIGDQRTESALERALQDSVVGVRIENSDLDLDPAKVRELTKIGRVTLETLPCPSCALMWKRRSG